MSIQKKMQLLTLMSIFLSAIASCYLQTSTKPASTPQLLSPTNTHTETATVTFTPIPTSTPTFPPTLTPLPTLSTEQAMVKIRELFETNGGCQLPCWWGAIPGTSSSNDFYNFIQSITPPQYYFYNRFNNGVGEIVEFFTDLPKDMQYYKDSILHGRLRADYGKITQIYIEGFDLPSYRLSAFLLENGKPDEVWVFAYRMFDQNADLPFSIYLLYSKKGMLLSYGGPAKQEGEIIRGCFDTSPELSIWSSEMKLTIAEAATLRGSEFNREEYKTIAEATQGKMNIDQFYEKLKDAKGNPCIEIDANLWQIIR